MIFRKRGTPDVICLPSGPVAFWEKRRSGKARAKMASVAVGGSVALAGCTTLGTNVSGDFACSAPNGTCAPSMVIDDRALAMITGSSTSQPAGPYPVTPIRGAAQLASVTRSVESPIAMARTNQKVLTVVFPAHVDARGRLYEATTVRTVVDNGSWAVASNGIPVRAIGIPASATEVGALEVDAVQPSPAENTTTLAYDVAPPPLVVGPDLPSAEAVAAARERGQSKTTVGSVVTASAESSAPLATNAPRGFSATVED